MSLIIRDNALSENLTWSHSLPSQCICFWLTYDPKPHVCGTICYCVVLSFHTSFVTSLYFSSIIWVYGNNRKMSATRVYPWLDAISLPIVYYLFISSCSFQAPFEFMEILTDYTRSNPVEKSWPKFSTNVS